MKIGLWRRCSSYVGAAAMALGLAGAAGAAHATDVRFTVAAYSEKTGPYFEKLADEFHKAHPDVTIRIETIPWETLFQRLTTDIAGGTPPDLAIIGTRWLTDFSAQGIAEPLDSYMSPAFKDRFIGSFFGPSTIGGKIMGLPVAASVRAMMINMDIMDKAGAKVPSTWDEVYAAAKKVKENTDYSGFGVQGKGIETDAYYYYALWTFGGDIFTRRRQERAGLESGRRCRGLLQEDDRRGPHAGDAHQLLAARPVQPVQAGQARHGVHLPDADPAGEGRGAEHALQGRADADRR